MNERYSRQTMLLQVGEHGQMRLHQASVLLVGVGGLGSPIALYLCAAGVGRIGLIDGDTVSVSNLQRQVLYQEAEVGLPKVECAKRRLLALNSAAQITTYPTLLSAENAAEVIAGYDIVVDGCDNYATRYLINDTCVALGKPYVYGSIGEFHGQVSVFNYQGGINYRHLYPNEEELLSLPHKTLGVLGILPGIIGCVEAAEVIKIATGCGEVLRNQLYTLDVLTMQSDIFRLK